MKERVRLSDIHYNLFLNEVHHGQVEPSAFASDAKVKSMLREMEELFAERFGMSLHGPDFSFSSCYRRTW